MRITTAGVCHSDLHLARGDWFGMQPRARPRGDRHRHGARSRRRARSCRSATASSSVSVAPVAATGAARASTASRVSRATAPRPRASWASSPSSSAVYAPGLVKLPDRIGDEEAPLACGGLTAYGAVKKLRKHGVLPGRPVAVFGAAGGLGHYAVQLATAFGYRVLAVDVGADRLDFARSLGAELAVEPDEAVEVVAAGVGGVHAGLVFSRPDRGFQLGLDVLRKARPLRRGRSSADERGQHRDQPLRVPHEGSDGHLLRRRDRAGHARARGPGRRGHRRTATCRAPVRCPSSPTIFDELEAGKYLGRAVITDLAS